MRDNLIGSVIAVIFIAAGGVAMAQTKADRCAAYARNAAANTATTTGVARGAARGTVGGAIAGNTGRGAAVGALVGGTRKAAQKTRSYNYYFDQCMRQ